VFTVTVASKDTTHRYNGQGSSNGYKIDGKFAPFLVLTPGVTYKFDQADGSNSGHPLRFYKDAAKVTAYTTNVTTNGTAGSSGAYTQIVTGDATPTILYYQCSAHGFMGNAIQTNGLASSVPDDGSISTAKIADDAVTDAKLANSINSAIAANTAKVQTTINNNADNRIITGSGTANTLNGESNLTFDNSNTKLTIGNPATIQSSSSGGALSIYGGNTNHGGQIDLSGGNADSNIIFRAQSGTATPAERMRIDSSGNVGIGVSPSRKLHVSGDILGNAFMLAANTSPSPSIQTQIYRVADNTLAFATNGSNERMRIDSSGRVGIGNDTSNFLSTSKLIVGSGSGDQGLTIYSGNSNNAFIHFADGTSGADKYRGYFEYAHGDNSIRVGVNDTERLRLLSSGGLTFNGDTAAANALDDYEEGTYAVTLSGNSGNYSLHGGVDRFSYIKIGRLVTIFGRILITAHNNVTGTPRINLPFNSMTGTEQSGQGQFGVYWHGWDVPSDGTGVSSLEFSGNSSVAYLLYHRDNTSWAGLNDLRTNMGNLYMALHGSYMTDS